MNTPIFNREFQHPADGWYQIEAKGEHPNSAAGIVQIIDDKAIQSIVNSFNADADAGKLRHGNEMLVDIDHLKDQPDQETRAYGWLQELQARADGIYGRIHWTKTGQSAVDGGDYRFFSTEYDPRDLQPVSNSDTRRVRPLKLDGLTLTNMNNNRGQKAITNRGGPSQNDVLSANITGQDARKAQEVAAWLFNQLVQLENQSSGLPMSVAWGQVVNREPALHAMAKGSRPPEQVLNVFPELAGRLKLYNRLMHQNLHSADSDAAANDVAKKALDFLTGKTATVGEPDANRLYSSNASAKTIWSSFAYSVENLMLQNGMTCSSAFNQVKVEQPTFWKMAMLSFEPALEGGCEPNGASV